MIWFPKDSSGWFIKPILGLPKDMFGQPKAPTEQVPSQF